MPEKPIEQVLAESVDGLMALPGVLGVAQGECRGEPCIRVFLATSTPELLRGIPPTIEGYEVDIQETGEIRALE